VLEPDHRVPRENYTVVGEAVRLLLEQRRRPLRRLAPGNVGAFLLEKDFGDSGGGERGRRVGAEAQVVV
jgi:hypothetical protein